MNWYGNWSIYKNYIHKSFRPLKNIIMQHWTKKAKIHWSFMLPLENIIMLHRTLQPKLSDILPFFRRTVSWRIDGLQTILIGLKLSIFGAKSDSQTTLHSSRYSESSPFHVTFYGMHEERIRLLMWIPLIIEVSSKLTCHRLFVYESVFIGWSNCFIITRCSLIKVAICVNFLCNE